MKTLFLFKKNYLVQKIQFYNDIVTKYNTELEVFPSNIVAGMFHFEHESLFVVDSDEARKNVKVDFGK